MRLCFACMNALMIKDEKILESEVKTKLLCCQHCNKKLPCVILIQRKAAAKLDQNIFEEYIRKSNLELIERWGDLDFQEEKARIREEAGLTPQRMLEYWIVIHS